MRRNGPRATLGSLVVVFGIIKDLPVILDFFLMFVVRLGIVDVENAKPCNWRRIQGAPVGCRVPVSIHQESAVHVILHNVALTSFPSWVPGSLRYSPSHSSRQTGQFGTVSVDSRMNPRKLSTDQQDQILETW